MYKYVYTILGYDLQEYRVKILTDNFRGSERYEELTCNQTEGRIQLFDDPINEKHLFLGYIIGEIPPDYGDYVSVSNPWDWEDLKHKVDVVVNEIFRSKALCILQYITFTEYR